MGDSVADAHQRQPMKVVTAETTINGSAREFEETTNWRRLERFALPGISSAGLGPGGNESEMASMVSSAFSASLEPGNQQDSSRGDGGCNPLFDNVFSATWPSGSLAFE